MERDVAGVTYVEAQAGKEYTVKVVVHKNVQNQFDWDFIKVQLSVDGTYVNIRKYMKLDANVSGASAYATFLGFREDFYAKQYQAFVFSEPEENVDHKNEQSSTGRIRVEFYEARPRNPSNDHASKGQPVIKTARVLSTQQNVKLKENTKPLERPSLKTCPGRAITPPPPPPPPQASPALSNITSTGDDGTNTTIVTHHTAPIRPVETHYAFRPMRGQPDATLEIRCHTADHLEFLQEFEADRAARAAGIRVTVDLTSDAESESAGEIKNKAQANSVAVDKKRKEAPIPDPVQALAPQVQEPSKKATQIRQFPSFSALDALATAAASAVPVAKSSPQP